MKWRFHSLYKKSVPEDRISFEQPLSAGSTFFVKPNALRQLFYLSIIRSQRPNASLQNASENQII